MKPRLFISHPATPPAASRVASLNDDPIMVYFTEYYSDRRSILGEPEPMATLINPRHELMAQNLATGMSTGNAYTAAGYKATGHSAESAGARLLTIVEVVR